MAATGRSRTQNGRPATSTSRSTKAGAGDRHAGRSGHAENVRRGGPDRNGNGLEELRTTATAAARLPLVAGREAIRTAHGLPAYLGVGALVAAGVVEWPVAAAAGVGVAALRRWGPAKADDGGADGSDAANAADADMEAKGGKVSVPVEGDDADEADADDARPKAKSGSTSSSTKSASSGNRSGKSSR